MPLSAEQVDRFNRDGFLFPIQVKNKAEADQVRAQWDELEAAEKLRKSHRNSMYNRHLDQEFIWKLVSDPLILNALEPLLGPNILLFGSRIICKWPTDGSVVAWHQDVSERNQLDPPIQITAWYAIDDSDEDNGCVCCIPGSHKRGMLKRHPAAVPGNLLRVNEESQIPDDMIGRAAPVTLKAGDLSLHHGFTVHSSPYNNSRRRRCGLVIRYVPAHVQQGSGVEFNQRETAIVLRGVDEMSGIDAHTAMSNLTLS
jgi:Phytanoyl-CoA dioxygenase (PhyH)